MSSSSTDRMSAGSGYLAACMGVMVASNGHVLGIEQHGSLAERSIASIRCAYPTLLSYSAAVNISQSE